MELNPRFRFETFVVGPSNRLAATAAQAVAAAPAGAYNPLFIYGSSGLGKTHLLHAIGFAAQEHQAGLRVRYLTLEEFVEQFHAAVAAGQADAFRSSTVEAEVVLLDDLQFLAKHREMQAELLRLSEALQSASRQVVLASDRPPEEIEELDERLIARLQGGLLVDLSPPDFETRLAILRRKAEERAVAFGAGVLEAVAEVGATNVRELLGLVNRLIAFQAVGEAPLTPSGARALLTGEEAGPGAEAAAVAPSGPGAAAPVVSPEPAPSPAIAGADREPGAGAGAAGPSDEFSSFLTAVRRGVTQSIHAWRERVSEAVLRWQGEGYRTARLEALLQQDTLPEAEEVLERFAADCEALRRLAAEAEAIDPLVAGHARFRDPDQLEAARGFVEELRQGLVPPPSPSAALTFEDYVVGAANEAVMRAARLVAQEPGRRFNPLYLAGVSGVGKSHLLHAIGNALSAPPGLAPRRVVCISASAFVEDLLGAINAGKLEWWRRRYRAADAFLLDDVQLISGREQTQDELFNLFNAFTEADKQLAFTADRLPRELEGVATRLITRFEGGLVVELAPPDRPMRESMVTRLLAAHGIQATEEVAQYLAERPADSARAVQGLVNRAISAMEVGDATLSLQAARTAIEGRISRPSQAQAVSAMMPDGVDPMLASRDKMLWDWPDLADRLVEELK